MRLVVDLHLLSIQLSVSIKLSSDNTYELDMDLCRKITASASSFTISPSKIEIKLKKAEPVRWETLEAAEDHTAKGNTRACVRVCCKC